MHKKKITSYDGNLPKGLQILHRVRKLIFVSSQLPNTAFSNHGFKERFYFKMFPTVQTHVRTTSATCTCMHTNPVNMEELNGDWLLKPCI